MVRMLCCVVLNAGLIIIQNLQTQLEHNYEYINTIQCSYTKPYCLNLQYLVEDIYNNMPNVIYCMHQLPSHA